MAYLKITKRSFEPSFPHDREKRLTIAAANDLKVPQQWPRNVVAFDTTVAVELSQYLTSDYVIASLLSFHPYRAGLGDIEVDISAPIVARHIVFEGRTYITQVSNAQGPKRQSPPKLLLILRM